MTIPREYYERYTLGYAVGAMRSEFTKEQDVQNTRYNLQSTQSDTVKTSLHKHNSLLKNKPKKKTKIVMPIIFIKVPSIKGTFDNYIQDIKGNLPIPAILDKIRSIHSKDVSDPKHWEDDNLYRYISRKMLEHQINNNPATQHHVNLGRQDRTVTDLTDSNTDMFSSLMPVKI